MDRGDWVEIVLVLHVLGAILGLGTNLTYGVIAARGERAGGSGRTFSLRTIQALDERLANPAYGAQLVTGLLLVWLLEIDLLDTSWLLAALGLYAVTAVLGAAVYAPTLRRQMALAEQLEAGGEATAEYRALARRSTTLGIVVTLIVVGIVILMVTKPSLW
jgi:uncharacterized membrane protein